MTIPELNRFARACVEQAPNTSDPEAARNLARAALVRASMKAEA